MNIDLVKQLITEFENSDVFKMKVEIEDIKLELEKAPVAPVNVVSAPVASMPVAPVAPAVSQVPEAPVNKEPEVSGTPVKSPIVGVFYAASSPTAKPYVEVGSKVKKGDILCIVEAMKLMNEIESEFDGEVVEVCVKDGDMVDYGKPLFKLK